MRTRHQTSVASRASVRSLTAACLPIAAVACAANSPALGAAINEASHPAMTVDDNTAASTNGASTNHSGSTTNNTPPVLIIQGIRG